MEGFDVFVYRHSPDLPQLSRRYALTLGMARLAQIGRGLGWSTVSLVVVTGAQLVFMAAMARLLNPADFGLVAMGGLSLRFATYFAQLGVAPAIVQKQNLTDDDIAAAFVVSVGLGVSFTVLAMIAAPIAEWFFGMQMLAEVVRVLAISFFISSLGIVPNALLRRSMRFKAIAHIEISAYLLGYGVVGLTLAWFKFGVWALVAAALTQTMLTAVGSFLTARFWKMKLVHTRVARAHFLSFGSKYSLIGFVEFLSFSIDSIIVGKISGQSSVGQYSRAVLLANLPVQQPVNVLTRVLLPSLARTQSEPEKFRLAVQVSLLAVSFYSFLVSGIVSVAASDLVAVLLGSQWSQAADALGVLALGSGPYAVSNVFGISMDARALLRQKLVLQLGMLLFLALLMLVLTRQYGVIGAAFALVATEWVRMAIYILIFTRQRVLESKFVMLTIGLPIVILTMTLFIAKSSLVHLTAESHVVNILIAVSIGFSIAVFLLICMKRFILELLAVQELEKRIPWLRKITL